MKIRSFSKFATFFTVAAALTFTSLSAHPRSCHRRIIKAVESTIEFQAAVGGAKGSFHDIFALLSQDYAYLGATPNPDPVTNAAVTGLLLTIHEKGDEAIVRFGDNLRDLGFSNSEVQLLETEFRAFFATAMNYARVMNLFNVFGAIPDQTGLDPALNPVTGNQETAAAALIASATAFGATLGALTDRPEIASQLASVGVLLTEAAQAFRGVLNQDNTFGATPALPATETSAAIRIFDILHEFVAAG